MRSLAVVLSAETAFYDGVPGHAALGIVQSSDGRTADHGAIQDANDPGGPSGYATAWLEYQHPPRFRRSGGVVLAPFVDDFRPVSALARKIVRMDRDGDQFVHCGLGHRHWGKYGAAGLLLHHGGAVLLQQRSALSLGPETWGLFGGARERDEPSVTAALREAAEESTLDVRVVRIRGLVREDHQGWCYDTVVGDVETRPEVAPASWESKDASWVPADEVAELNLFPSFAISWPKVRDAMRRPVLVVDTANVMGSRNDGWWRDRHGAATRLRDQIDALEGFRLPPFDVAFPELVMIVEGKARGVGDGEHIRVISAEGDGDDTIVDTVREYADLPDADVYVVTADRELKRRSQDAGASILGPRWLLDQL